MKTMNRAQILASIEFNKETKKVNVEITDVE